MLENSATDTAPFFGEGSLFRFLEETSQKKGEESPGLMENLAYTVMGLALAQSTPPALTTFCEASQRCGVVSSPHQKEKAASGGQEGDGA